MYTKNIKNPYSIALEIPLSLSFFLVKKLTVKGIIGNTQGVKRAKNPPKIPNKNILTFVLLSAQVRTHKDIDLILQYFEY